MLVREQLLSSGPAGPAFRGVAMNQLNEDVLVRIFQFIDPLTRYGTQAALDFQAGSSSPQLYLNTSLQKTVYHRMQNLGFSDSEPTAVPRFPHCDQPASS